jgi:DnaJ-class molecular chaperone
MLPDYYKLLGVTPTASRSEIKRAYRHLARLHHPDLNVQAQDAQIKRLNEAYAVLSHPQKRAAYDELRRRERARVEAECHRQEQARREPEMTWIEGIVGFVRELKKGMRDD